MKGIKEYIQFAEDNGYKIKDRIIDETHLFLDGYNNIQEGINGIEYSGGTIDFYKLITSKPFIEAIARGLKITLDEQFKLDENYDEILDKEGVGLLGIIYDITILQAIAIRENKLEEYISNLGK